MAEIFLIIAIGYKATNTPNIGIHQAASEVWLSQVFSHRMAEISCFLLGNGYWTPASTLSTENNPFALTAAELENSRKEQLGGNFLVI